MMSTARKEGRNGRTDETKNWKDDGEEERKDGTDDGEEGRMDTSQATWQTFIWLC